MIESNFLVRGLRLYPAMFRDYIAQNSDVLYLGITPDSRWGTRCSAGFKLGLVMCKASNFTPLLSLEPQDPAF